MTLKPISGDRMINQKKPARELAALLDDHLAEVAEAWAERVYQSASFRPSEGWQDALRASAKRGLQAAIDDLKSGTYSSLNAYVTELSIICWQRGFTNGEMTESLLLCKEAILSVIRGYAFDLDRIWSLIAELDSCLRWMVGCFNTQFEAETNRRLRKQHEHIVSMLRMGVRDADSIDIDEVLRQVADGIIGALEVDHCDFYLMDEDQSHLTPRCGVSKAPLSPAAAHYFLSHPPDLSTDLFIRELLERKEPLVSQNAQNDPRVNQELAKAMSSKTVLMVPLVANDRVLAVAATGTFRDYRAFTQEQIELAWDVARAATLVIENARLRQQMRYVAALEERERLAREIHDNLAQALSILKLQASNIDDLIRHGQIEQAQIFLSEMKKTASEAHTDAREAILGLRHSASSAAEFVPELRAYLEKYRSTYGIDVQLVVQDRSMDQLPTTITIQLTRIIQEALTNIRKHAAARTVVVRLETDDAHLSMIVEDDGQGFDPVEVMKNSSGGVGLQIMRERAESLGGHLEIDASPGRGTHIMAQIPF